MTQFEGFLNAEGELREAGTGRRLLEEDVRFGSVEEAQEFCEREGVAVAVVEGLR